MLTFPVSIGVYQMPANIHLPCFLAKDHKLVPCFALMHIVHVYWSSLSCYVTDAMYSTDIPVTDVYH